MYKLIANSPQRLVFYEQALEIGILIETILIKGKYFLNYS